MGIHGNTGLGETNMQSALYLVNGKKKMWVLVITEKIKPDIYEYPLRNVKRSKNNEDSGGNVATYNWSI